MLTVVSMRAIITFATEQSREIGRYQVPRKVSLSDLGIGMTIDDIQIAVMRHNVRVIEECELFNHPGSKVL